MVPLGAMVTALADKLGNIQNVVAMLAPLDPIVAYIDNNPVANSIEKALYQMQPGQVLVMWTETRMTIGEMARWSHLMEICIRALPDQSDLEIVDAIMAGIPVPGDGMIWRNCPIMAGLLPTDVTAIERRTDSEGVDYAVIMTETAETGDWPNP
jgi:hypothetical protein